MRLTSARDLPPAIIPTATARPDEPASLRMLRLQALGLCDGLIDRASRPSCALAEGEDVRAYAGFPERDLEGALGGTATPADELVHPRLSDGAFAETR
jgi:hypothetical protein